MSGFPRPRFAMSVALAISTICPAFAAGVSFTAKSSPGYPGVNPPLQLHADLNHDGREDFVFGIGFTETYVVLSNGDGTYATPVGYPLPYSEIQSAIALGDFNGDGNDDMLIAGFNAYTSQADMFLYTNNGNGQFTMKASFPLSSPVTQMTTADFNHDEKMDVAVQGATGISIWAGNGSGTFNIGPVTAIKNVGGKMMLGDFDGDGHADLAIPDPVNMNNVVVLFGDGRGNFPSQYTIRVPGGSSQFQATDVNTDGTTDIVASTFYPQYLKHIDVYYGGSSRNFVNHTIIPTAQCPVSAPIAADLDGNGYNDLVLEESNCAVLNNRSSTQFTVTVNVLTRNPNSSYNADQVVATLPANTGIDADKGPVVIRGNADTKPDILFTACAKNCATNNTIVLLNTTTGAFHSCNAPLTLEGINVCSPPMSGSSSSPVRFSVGAAGQVAMRKVEVWVDGKKEIEQLNGFSNYTFLDRSVTLGSGNHQVNIYAAGIDNQLQEKSFKVYVP